MNVKNTVASMPSLLAFMDKISGGKTPSRENLEHINVQDAIFLPPYCIFLKSFFDAPHTGHTQLY